MKERILSHLEERSCQVLPESVNILNKQGIDQVLLRGVECCNNLI